MTGYVITPLHVRSGYSLLRGTVGIKPLLRRASALGCDKLAIADVNSLCGATVFWKLAEQAGILPIIGAELVEGGRSIVALVETCVGYENLCRAITRINRRQAERVDSNGSAPWLVGDLAELSDGLCLIAEDDELAGYLIGEGVDRRRLHIGVDPATQSYPQLRRLGECAARLGLNQVATGKALMSCGHERQTARILAAIRLGVALDAAADDELPHPRAVLRSPKVLSKELVDLPEAVRNNNSLSERCAAFKLLPRRPVFPAFATADGRTAKAHLRWLCRKGIDRRYEKCSPDVLSRVEQELALIETKGFSEYFLVVRDIVQYARDRGAPVAGRGSGASSLVAYLLGITNVCPIAYEIPFERFLNDQREDFPDLDVDFCWRLRDEVIDYSFSRWGERYVAMVSMHLTFQPRSAVREAAKALGLSNEQISRMIKQGVNLGNVRESPARRGKRSYGAFSGLSESFSRRVLELSRRILHLPHSLSVHPGGIVIGRKPIDRYVPVQKAAKGVWITQYDKDGVEDIGLVKLDLLGNRNLSTIRYACDLIAERTGRRIEADRLPSDDPPTIRLLQSADTVGCNQLESPAMRHLLRMMKPSDTRDIMKILALIRPGAASMGMKEAFIRRHRGLEKPPTAPRAVERVLSGTFGVMLYEDDVMLVAAAMLGCSLGEADRFRRAIQKCSTDQARIELSREFLARCRVNGIEPDYAKSMWVQMAKYNAYSFCRAHAASYAVLAYGGAYLRTHYPLEFWTAALNNNQSMYHPRVYVEQAKHAGVRFLLPDVNRSAEQFLIDPARKQPAIRVGLNFIAGLGPAGATEILNARKRGPFEGLSDFLSRTSLAEEDVRSLILCGAFDWAGRNRPELMLELGLFSKLERTVGGRKLLVSKPVIPPLRYDYSPQRKYFDQRRILGITVGDHMMTLYRPLLAGSVDADSRNIEKRSSMRIRIAGFLEARRTATTRRGESIMFLTLEDEYGLFEVTLMPGVARRGGGDFLRYGPYVVTGRVEDQYDSLSITAERVEYFDVSEGQLALARPEAESA